MTDEETTMTDVPHIITELSLTLTPEQAQQDPRPDRTPIGPFRNREIAEDYAQGQIALHGGTGEASFAPLRPAPVFRKPHPFEPPGLRALVETITYKAGWEFSLGLFVEDGDPRAWAFYVVSDTANSYKPAERIRVRHEFLIPPASYNRDTWVAWLFDRIRDVETHEAGEFFMVDGVREFGPHHGNGEDPYRVWHVGDHEQARTKAGRDNAVSIDVTGKPRRPCAVCGADVVRVDFGLPGPTWVHAAGLLAADAHSAFPQIADRQD